MSALPLTELMLRLGLVSLFNTVDVSGGLDGVNVLVTVAHRDVSNVVIEPLLNMVGSGHCRV